MTDARAPQMPDRSTVDRVATVAIYTPSAHAADDVSIIGAWGEAVVARRAVVEHVLADVTGTSRLSSTHEAVIHLAVAGVVNPFAPLGLPGF